MIQKSIANIEKDDFAVRQKQEKLDEGKQETVINLLKYFISLIHNSWKKNHILTIFTV